MKNRFKFDSISFYLILLEHVLIHFSSNRSTKELMKYLDEHNLPIPKYLVKMNALNAKSNDSSCYTPLHAFYQ